MMCTFWFKYLTKKTISLFLKSSSPIWNPQYTGVVPGFVFDVLYNEHANNTINVWKNNIRNKYRIFNCFSINIKIIY